ncbi:MAG: NADH:flavin oxidoreductase [Planctomycetota bacterium]
MKSLFQETRIRSLKVPNRFMRSATWMALADPEGYCNKRVFQCYEELGRGALGLIISGFGFVSPEGQGPAGQLGFCSNAHVDGLRVLTQRVHDQGGRMAAQIVHCGNQSKPENNGNRDVLGPSDRFDEEGKQVARALTLKEIGRIVDDFGAAAERVRDAGFDAVQLHFAHGYLGSQFLSPYHNERKDEYGGSIENRCRFLSEAYLKVRAAVGEAFPVMAKLNIEDFVDTGLTCAHGLKAATLLENLGLDALEVSGGMAASGRLGPARRIKGREQEAYFRENAAAVKTAVGRMPVILVGGLRSPELMAEIHHETGIDYFSLSRPLIREPGLVKRWKKGDSSPAACVSCSGCFLSIKYGEGVFCIKTRKAKGDETPT